MSSQWKNDKSVRTWMLPKSCKIFSAKFDEIQQQLQAISCMDDLLAGVVYTFEVSSGVNNVLTLMYIYTIICYRNAE